jgi:hypothetical protein
MRHVYETARPRCRKLHRNLMQRYKAFQPSAHIQNSNCAKWCDLGRRFQSFTQTHWPKPKHVPICYCLHCSLVSYNLTSMSNVVCKHPPFTYIRCHDSSISVVTVVWDGRPRNQSSISDRDKRSSIFSLPQYADRLSRWAARDFFVGAKRPGPCSWQLASIQCAIRHHQKFLIEHTNK